LIGKRESLVLTEKKMARELEKEREEGSVISGK